jgi:ABC-type lipoprotein export system ATPase subunit
MGLLDEPTGGTVEIAGRPVQSYSDRELARLRNEQIGFVFQSYHLIDGLTVRENIEVPLSYRDVKRSESQAIVADTLDQFQIVGKKDLFPNQLSGGQQQLVAVARAVVHGPKLILADEPTGNLHSSQGREIMELFKRLNAAGTTIIQVTHSEVNAGYGDRVIQLADGWVVKEGQGQTAA